MTAQMSSEVDESLDKGWQHNNVAAYNAGRRREKEAWWHSRARGGFSGDADETDGVAAPSEETDAIAIGSEDESEDEASDADSEPLEYAMLSVAANLPSGEASEILGKVRRQHERHNRLKQVLRDRTASLSSGSPDVSKKGDDGRSGDAVAEVVAKMAEEEVEGEEAEAAEKEEEHEGEADDDARAAAAAGEGDGPLEAAPEAAQQTRRKPRGPVSRLLLGSIWVACFGVFFACQELEVGNVGPTSAFQHRMPRYNAVASNLTGRVCREPPCEESGAEGDEEAEHALFIAEIEERLHRSRSFARTRSEWLGGAARVVVGGITVCATMSLFLALVCWKQIIGAVVAVFAGAVIFVLAVVALDSSS